MPSFVPWAALHGDDRWLYFTATEVLSLGLPLVMEGTRCCGLRSAEVVAVTAHGCAIGPSD